MSTLELTLTLSEVAQMWGKHPNTVRCALGAKKRPLIFRPASCGYLIDYQSCVHRWGKPKFPLTPRNL